MKILPKKFTQLGYTLEQIKRENDIAIYKRTKKDQSFPEFEVIKIKGHPGYEIAGHKIGAAESYPGAKAFGTLGWSFISLEDAEKKFKLMRQKISLL